MLITFTYSQLPSKQGNIFWLCHRPVCMVGNTTHANDPSCTYHIEELEDESKEEKYYLSHYLLSVYMDNIRHIICVYHGHHFERYQENARHTISIADGFNFVKTGVQCSICMVWYGMNTLAWIYQEPVNFGLHIQHHDKSTIIDWPELVQKLAQCMLTTIYFDRYYIPV
jgi:hypothetical protein